jgi:hypothetical protein
MYRTGIADWDEALRLIEQSIEVHERIGNPRQREEGLAVLAFIRQCRGQFEAALAAWRQAYHSAYQRGDGQVQMWSLSGIIENLVITRREAQAAQALPDTALGPRSGNAPSAGVGVGKPAASKAHPIRAVLEQAARLYDEIGDLAAQISAHAFLALVALREGDDRAALDGARHALEMVQTTSPMTFSNMDGYAAMAEVLLTLWARAVEHDVVPQTQPEPTQHGLWAASGYDPRTKRFFLSFPVLRDRRVLRGEISQVAELERLAQAACTALHNYAKVFPVAEPHALRWQGRRYWLQGRHRQGIQLWRAGIHLAQQLGMPYLHAQIERDLKRAMDGAE